MFKLTLIKTACFLLAGFLAETFVLPAPSANGYEPQWSPVIIATGQYRAQLQATPIEHRPNRPFHFYGNAVRRRHHTGRYLPTVISGRLPLAGR